MADPDRARGGLDALPAAPVVVLVGTQLGENVGTTARAMLNFGLFDLRLVRPKCGWPNVKALNACSGAVEVLNRVQLFESVEAATADLHRLYATTARPRDLAKPVITAAAAALETRAAQARGERVGLLFGPEKSGLSNDDLIYADAVLSIPLNPAFTSLNLAQAVLLVAYEWFKAGDLTPPRQEAAPAGRPATKGELDGLVEHLLRQLDAVDFFRAPDRRLSLARTIRLVFERARLHEPDVHLLHGIIKSLARGGTRDGS